MADVVITEELLNYFWNNDKNGAKTFISRLDSIGNELNATLLLGEITDIPVSSAKRYVLNDKWENYKILSIMIEMSYSSTDIRLYNYNYFTKVLSNFKSVKHQIYRQVATGSSSLECGLQMRLSPNANEAADATTIDKEIFFQKSGSSYDGARKVWVYGIN